MKKSLSILISIACNLTINLNKQRQEHNNLATIWREKLKGAMSVQEPSNYKMQNLNAIPKKNE